MKKLASVLTLALVMVLAASSQAYALPFVGIAVAFLSGASAAISLGASLAVAGLVGAGMAALSYVSSAAQGGAGKSAAANYGKMQTGGVVDQSIGFGPYGTPGSLVYFNYWGQDGKTPNAYESRVVALSDIPSAGLAGLKVGETLCTYGEGTPHADLGYAIPEFNKDGKDHLWVKFYDGWQTAADPFLVSKFSAHASRPYSSARVGRGRAYVVVTIRTGHPDLNSSADMKFRLLGGFYYNPAKDSTAGGTGSHRWNDMSTWEYTENPQVIRYNLRRGIYAPAVDGEGNPTREWMMGLQGMSPARLPLANWSAAFADCDAEVTNSEGEEEPAYRCGGEVTVSTEPATLDESLMRACNARAIEAGGVHLTITGPVGSPTKSYTDKDFLITSPQRFEQYPGLSGIVNGVRGRWPDPAQNYTMTDAPARKVPELIAEDNGRELWADLNFDVVPFGEQVQRNMKAGLEEERRWRTHDVVWPHTEWLNLPGDAFPWASEKNGYDAKLFRIETAWLLPNRDIAATIREVDPADYDFDPETDFIPVQSGSLSPNPVPPQPMDGFEVEGIVIEGDDGKERAGVRFEWTPDDNDDVRGVMFQVRKAGGGDPVLRTETEHFTDGLFETSENLLPLTEYAGRAKFIAASGRETLWSDWEPFTTPDVRIRYSDLTDALKDAIDQIEINTDALGFLSDQKDKSDARLRQLGTNLGRLSLALLEVQMVIPQLEDRYQRQLAAYVSTVTGTDVSQFASRLLVSEQTIIDLQNNKAAASALAALDALISTPTTGLLAIVGQLQETVASLDESQATATLLRTAAAVRIAGQRIQSLANTVLNLESILHNVKKDQATALAWFQEEITVQVKEGQTALARAVADLGAFLKNADGDIRASVVVEQEARVAGDTAQAQTSSGILAILSGYSTPGSVQAAVNTASSAYVSPLGAVSDNVTTLASYFGSGINGSTTVKSLIDAANAAREDGDDDVAAGAAALVEAESETRADADEALAEDVTSLYSAYDSVSASGYFSIITQSAPAGSSARAALVVSQTSGGSPNTAAMFMDALTSGLTRILFKAAQTAFLDDSNNVIALFASGGAYLAAGVFADSGILGPKVQLGEMSKPYQAKLGSSVFTNNTALSLHEVLRITVRSLGGLVRVDGWLNAKKNGSGSYNFAKWHVYRTTVGGLFGSGTNVNQNEFYMNDGGEVHRSFSAIIASGTYAYDAFFDLVFVVQNENASNKPIEVYDAELTVDSRR